MDQGVIDYIANVFDIPKLTQHVSAVEGRKITFDIEASDGVGIIGHGTHERFVINNEKFMAKVASRAKSN